MIGEKIKELRIINKMTQKDLAERLYVTAQAVSRWENGEVEPSISTLVEISKIFNVSVDELLNVNITKEVIVEKEYVYADVPKQHLTICSCCNKPIYEQNDLFRVGNKNASRVLCKECHDKELAEIETKKKKIEENNVKEGKKKRVKSFVYGGLVSLIPLLVTFNTIRLGGSFGDVIYGLVVTYMVFAFFATMILGNIFVSKTFFTINSWAWVKFPGIIWEFSLDGFIGLIVIKLIFFAISMILALLFAALATIVCTILSFFTYPFAIRRNFKNPGFKLDI